MPKPWAGESFLRRVACLAVTQWGGFCYNAALTVKHERSFGMSEETLLDVTGLNCPLPILKAKKALATLPSGSLLRVWATDAGAPDDFAAFCRQTGHVLVSSQALADGRFDMLVQRK